MPDRTRTIPVCVASRCGLVTLHSAGKEIIHVSGFSLSSKIALWAFFRAFYCCFRSHGIIQILCTTAHVA